MDCLIIGGGCAGYTAAIYAGRAGLKPFLIEGTYEDGLIPGGQLTTTSEVENYPGFETIGGYELMERMKAQAEKWGTTILSKTVSHLNSRVFPYEVYLVGEEKALQTRSIIIATGATAKRLGIPGEERLWTKGISACAVCDGSLPIFRKKVIAVVGGGDSACEEALFLSKYASEVVMINRTKKFRASKIMLERVNKCDRIRILTDTIVTEVQGEDQVRGIQVKNLLTAEERSMDVSGLFYAIGHTVNTQFLQGTGIELDNEGYIVNKLGTRETSVKGIFSAGDVSDRRYKQAITASASGCMAALEADHWLQSLN